MLFLLKRSFFSKICVFSKEIQIEEKKIEIIKNWPKRKLIKDIQVFIGFINFYQQFIKTFSNIITLLILMFKVKSLNNKIINSSNGIKISSRKNSYNNNGAS